MRRNRYKRQADRISIEDLAAIDKLRPLLDAHVPYEYKTHFEPGKFAREWKPLKSLQILAKDRCEVVPAHTTIEIPVPGVERVGPYEFLDKVDRWFLPLHEAIKAQAPDGQAPPLVDGDKVREMTKQRTTPLRSDVQLEAVAEPYEGGIVLGRFITYADFLWGMAHRWLREPMRINAGHDAVTTPYDQLPAHLGHPPIKVLMAHSVNIVAVPESQALHNRQQ